VNKEPLNGSSHSHKHDDEGHVDANALHDADLLLGVVAPPNMHNSRTLWYKTTRYPLLAEGLHPPHSNSSTL
jgi:hypothetical protein